MFNFNKIQKSINSIFRIKNITLLAGVFFFALLVPVFICSFVNRASGDDIGYSILTRNAWINSYSLIEVLKAAGQTVVNYYKSWQGTWFSIFLFSLQPELFHESFYVVVAFLMLFLWIGSSYLLAKELLIKRLKLGPWHTYLAFLFFMIVSISFIPSTKSSIFWYNGCAHYMIPFAMCQMVAYWLLKWTDTYEISDFIKITLFTLLLGGANYQASLLALIITSYFIFFDFLNQKNRKVFFLFLPMALEAIGLYISMKSPGNKIRGGEEFGFSLEKILQTILLCFVKAFKELINHMIDHPVILLGLFMILVIFIIAFQKRELRVEIKFSCLLFIALICLYSAMQAPEIYAGVDVSRGVENTNFQICILMLVGCLVLLADKISKWMNNSGIRIPKEENIYKMLGILGLIILLLCRSDIKETTTWICLEYITSGQARDYKEQMDEQTKIMKNQEIKNVVVPFINDVQGPLMHMPITIDPEAWTSTITRDYYGKESVVAMERSEWYEEYGYLIKE